MIHEHPKPKTFWLKRLTDISGISGTGIVAEGTLYHDGQITLSWFGRFHNMEVFPDLKTLVSIHGHNGATVVEWIEVEATAPKEVPPPGPTDWRSWLQGTKE